MSAVGEKCFHGALGGNTDLDSLSVAERHTVQLSLLCAQLHFEYVVHLTLLSQLHEASRWLPGPEFLQRQIVNSILRATLLTCLLDQLQHGDELPKEHVF